MTYYTLQETAFSPMITISVNRKNNLAHIFHPWRCKSYLFVNYEVKCQPDKFIKGSSLSVKFFMIYWFSYSDIKPPHENKKCREVLCSFLDFAAIGLVLALEEMLKPVAMLVPTSVALAIAM